MATQRLLSRIARSLLRRYPQVWRERYEGEVLALLEESPAGFADVAELTRGLLVEHVRALVSAVDRASRTLSIVAALRPALVVGFTASAVVAGFLLRRWEPGMTALSQLAQWMYLSLLLVVIGARFRLRRRRRDLGPHTPMIFPPWTGLISLPAAFLTILFYEWTYVETRFQLDHYWLHRFTQVYLYGVIVSHLSSGLWPGEALLAAFQHLEASEVQLRAAEKWVKDCHEMIAKGEPASLADAEAAVERWTRERDKALAKAEQLGYRARFRSV